MIRVGDRGPKYLRFSVGTGVNGLSAARMRAAVSGPNGEARDWELTQIIASSSEVSGLRIFASDGSEFPSPGRWEVRIFVLDSGNQWIADESTSFHVSEEIAPWPS